MDIAKGGATTGPDDLGAPGAFAAAGATWWLESIAPWGTPARVSSLGYEAVRRGPSSGRRSRKSYFGTRGLTSGATTSLPSRTGTALTIPKGRAYDIATRLTDRRIWGGAG
jgi:hypothetical protein